MQCDKSGQPGRADDSILFVLLDEDRDEVCCIPWQESVDRMRIRIVGAIELVTVRFKLRLV